MSPSVVADTLTEHIARFVERPHPGLLGQPVCPFARRARVTGRIEVIVTPFSADDDSAVTWAVESFDPLDKDVLLVVHPNPHGVNHLDLSDLRDRFAGRLAGRYEVFTGHPDDPFTTAGVFTRREPFPVLHFVRAERLREAEGRLGPRRRALAG